MATARRRKKSAARRHASRTPAGKHAAPWTRPNPKPKRRRSPLSQAAKRAAKRAARRAGRPYPNLVDNMRAARASG